MPTRFEHIQLHISGCRYRENKTSFACKKKKEDNITKQSSVLSFPILIPCYTCSKKLL